MKKCFLLFSLVFLSNLAKAQMMTNVYIDYQGIKYVLDIYTHTASVYDDYFRESERTDIVIPSVISQYDISFKVTSIRDHAFSNSGIETLKIPEGVVSIGDCTFEYCKKLKSINIPNSVTSIGKAAFINCPYMTSMIVKDDNPNYDSRNNCNAIIETTSNTLIAGCMNTTIPNSVTSIGDYAFDHCSSLTNINIPNSVKNIGRSAFEGCTGLTSIDIPNSVTYFDDAAFKGCTSLTSITIPSSVIYFGDCAFESCASLTNIDIPNGVKSIGLSAFYKCI